MSSSARVGRRRATGLRRVVLVLTMVVAAGPACSDGTGSAPKAVGPTDRSVCGSLQRMVDGLAEGRSPEAVTAYDEMVSVANAAPESTPVIDSARRMSAITDAEVDESKLPMSEVSDLARTAMLQSGDALAQLAAACGDSDMPITGMEQAGQER